jgi:hypothetical protein
MDIGTRLPKCVHAYLVHAYLAIGSVPSRAGPATPARLWKAHVQWTALSLPSKFTVCMVNRNVVCTFALQLLRYIGNYTITPTKILNRATSLTTTQRHMAWFRGPRSARCLHSRAAVARTSRLGKKCRHTPRTHPVQGFLDRFSFHCTALAEPERPPLRAGSHKQGGLESSHRPAVDARNARPAGEELRAMLGGRPALGRRENAHSRPCAPAAPCSRKQLLSRT